MMAWNPKKASETRRYTMNMKYIHFSHKGLHVIVQFQEIISHKDMAQAIRRYADVINSDPPEKQPAASYIISAGFVQAHDDRTFSCYGESESLGGIKSMPEDSAILTRQYSPY